MIIYCLNDWSFTVVITELLAPPALEILKGEYVHIQAVILTFVTPIPSTSNSQDCEETVLRTEGGHRVIRLSDQQRQAFVISQWGWPQKDIMHQCDYQPTQRRNLQVHIQSKHERVRYPCSKCDYQATTQGSLQKHIQSQHEGIKYPCNQCDYQATAQSSLKDHISWKHSDTVLKCDKVWRSKISNIILIFWQSKNFKSTKTKLYSNTVFLLKKLESQYLFLHDLQCFLCVIINLVSDTF